MFLGKEYIHVKLQKQLRDAKVLRSCFLRSGYIVSFWGALLHDIWEIEIQQLHLKIRLHKVDHIFLPLCTLCKLSCAAPGVGYIGDDIVGFFEHPLVTPRDSKARMYGFNTLREHGVRVVIILGLFSGHVDQHYGVIDLRVFVLQISQNTVHDDIKSPLVDYIEHIHVAVFN